MTTGQIVLSKCGRDKGQCFVILSVENDYVYLVNGQTRPLCKPKKKKSKHVQPTNTVVDLSGVQAATDADIRKTLLAVYSEHGEV